MLALVIEVLRLFITFLQQVVTLLETRLTIEDTPEELDAPVSRTPSPTLSTTIAEGQTARLRAQRIQGHFTHLRQVSLGSPSSPETRRSTSPASSSTVVNETPRSPSSPEPPAPLSPSAWRGIRVPNSQLRLEYRASGVCGHYFHESAQPRLRSCPVCDQLRDH